MMDNLLEVRKCTTNAKAAKVELNESKYADIIKISKN